MSVGLEGGLAAESCQKYTDDHCNWSTIPSCRTTMCLMLKHKTLKIAVKLKLGAARRLKTYMTHYS